MSVLMSKEVMYEPLKEMRDKLPDYLRTHKSEISPDDLSRCVNQTKVIATAFVAAGN